MYKVFGNMALYLVFYLKEHWPYDRINTLPYTLVKLNGIKTQNFGFRCCLKTQNSGSCNLIAPMRHHNIKSLNFLGCDAALGLKK